MWGLSLLVPLLFLRLVIIILFFLGRLKNRRLKITADEFTLHLSVLKVFHVLRFRHPCIIMRYSVFVLAKISLQSINHYGVPVYTHGFICLD